MPVKIRLRRQGAHKQPTYRVVVADSRSPRDGAFIEIIGHYNPRTDPTTIVINEQKALLWLNRGAQPTDVVTRLMKKVGILDRFEAAKHGETGGTTPTAAQSVQGTTMNQPESAAGMQETPEPAVLAGLSYETPAPAAGESSTPTE